jgi:Na+/proline symporter
MEKILSPVGGMGLIACFGLVMIFIAVWVTRGRKGDCEEFLVANRELGLVPMAMSIAASWIWAPALFVAAQKSFEQGLAGIFWYCFPNFLSLVVFGLMALRLRQRLPKGFTFPQYVRLRHGRAVHILYLVQFFILQMCCFAVQLLAGAGMMNALSGLDFTLATILLTGLTVSYALFGGIRASVATDFLQMGVILIVIAITVPWTIASVGGMSTIAKGLGGWSGKYEWIFDPWVAYSFGIPVSISLMSGPIGDQMHWQRGFAVRSDRMVVQSYLLGAVLFVIVPFSLGLLGFAAAGLQLDGLISIAIDDKKQVEMVGPTIVGYALPKSMLVAFSLMILSGLCSTLDSVLCAVSSLVAADVYPRNGSQNDQHLTDSHALRAGRIGMCIVALLAIPIANIPNLTILHLFIFYGTWRASTMVPTYLTLLWNGLNSRCVFVSIFLCLAVGSPILAFGHIYALPHLVVIGSVSVLVISLLLCVFGSLIYGSDQLITEHDTTIL